MFGLLDKPAEHSHSMLRNIQPILEHHLTDVRVITDVWQAG
jgi:hypothetical protein